MSKNEKTIWQQDKDHFIHPWTDFSTFKDEGSLVLTDGSGITLTDSEGKQYNINETLKTEGHAYEYYGGKKQVFKG